MSLAESYPIWSEKDVGRVLDANFLSGETEHLLEAQLNLLDDIEATSGRWYDRHRALFKDSCDSLMSLSETKHPLEAAQRWAGVVQRSNACLMDDVQDAVRLYVRSMTEFWTL